MTILLERNRFLSHSELDLAIENIAFVISMLSYGIYLCIQG